MNPESEELLSAWQAVYAEQNPGRDPERMQYTDAMLAGFTLMRREIRMSRPAPPDPSKSFTPRGKIIHSLGRYNGESE